MANDAAVESKILAAYRANAARGGLQSQRA